MKQFLALLTGNDKNCTPNVVGMFRVQTEVIQARFWTLPAPGLFRWFQTWKSNQNLIEIFFNYTDKKW